MGPQPLSQACRKTPLSAPRGATHHLPLSRELSPWQPWAVSLGCTLTGSRLPSLREEPPTPWPRRLWASACWHLDAPGPVAALPHLCTKSGTRGPLSCGAAGQCHGAPPSSRLRRCGAGQPLPPTTGAQNGLPASLFFYVTIRCPDTDWDPGEGRWPLSPWPTLTCAEDSRPAFGVKLCLLVISVSARGH